MICRECLKIIYIVRGFCHGTAVKNGFYLTQKSLKAFIIHRLLSDAWIQHLFTSRISLSQIPPTCGQTGGLNIHLSQIRHFLLSHLSFKMMTHDTVWDYFQTGRVSISYPIAFVKKWQHKNVLSCTSRQRLWLSPVSQAAKASPKHPCYRGFKSCKFRKIAHKLTGMSLFNLTGKGIRSTVHFNIWIFRRY